MTDTKSMKATESGELQRHPDREAVLRPAVDASYAAGYYSYKWAEVLAADAFAAFQEVGLEDEAAVAEVADRFRRTVLGLGGSLPAAEVYRQFRGRDATADALLIDQGLKAAS